MKKIRLIFALLLVFAFSVSAGIVSALAADSDSAHVIRMELDLQNTVKWEKGEGDEGDVPVAGEADRIFYIASPFGDSFSSQGVKLREGDRIRYSFYTPTPLEGMGGLEMQIYGIDSAGKGVWRNISAMFGDEKIVDENGMSAFLMDDITTYLGNGWYERSFEFPAQIYDKYTEITLWHLWLAGAVKTDEAKALKDEGKNLVMYYKNFEIVNATGNVQSIYNESSGGAPFSNWEGFTFGNENLNIPNDEEHGGERFPAYGDTAFYFVAGGDLYLEEVSDPDPITIELNQSRIFLSIGNSYTLDDLLSYVKTDGVTVSGIAAPDGTDCMPEEGESFTPQAEGTYTITFRKTAGEGASAQTVVYNCPASAYPADKPVILEDELPAGDDGVTGEKYYLPEVLAYVGGERTRETEITVQRADGTAMTVESDENGKYFVPTLRTETDYTITYTAAGDYDKTGENTWEKSVTVHVIDNDIPTVDFSAWQKNIEIGSTFRLPEIIVNDISDGTLELTYDNKTNGKLSADFKVFDSRGAEVAVSDSGTIRPTLSGSYTLWVTATDSHGNTREYEYVFTVDAIENAVYSAYMHVSEDSRAEGQRKFFMATTHSTYSDYVTIQAGDKLVFDVYTETPMPGIGSFSGQIHEGGNSWPFFHDFYGTGADALKDSNGESMEPTADISHRLQDGNGNPVWYHREVELGENMIGKNIAHFSPIIDTTSACGEEIEVLYRNVYILRRGGTKVPVLPGDSPIDPVVWNKDGADSADLSATLDPTPVLLTQFITADPQLGHDIHIGKDIVYDYMNSATVPVLSLKITDSSGTEYPVTETKTGYVFNTGKEGTYTVSVEVLHGSRIYTFEHVFTLADDEFPVITLGEYSETVAAGSDFRLPEVTLSDNITPADEMSYTVVAYRNGQPVNIEDNTIKNVEAGQYMLVYTCSDVAGNETVLSVSINVEEGGGCGSAISAGSIILAVMAVAAAALIVLKAKRRYTDEK